MACWQPEGSEYGVVRLNKYDKGLTTSFDYVNSKPDMCVDVLLSLHLTSGCI